MNMIPITRCGGVAALTLGLAGCVDVSMEVEVLGIDEARILTTTGMSRELYAMFSSLPGDQEADGEDGGDDLCEDGETVETATTVDCVTVFEGSFAEIMTQLEETDSGSLVIEAIGNNQVRVSFPLDELTDEVVEGTGGAVDDDPQARAMIAAMFEGSTVSIVVSGGPILDTNMEIAPDGNSASYALSFTDILTGDPMLPDEFYAVVQK